MKKRLISLLMALVMLLAAAVPATAAITDPNGTGLDVVILIDRSGSMPTTDPGEIALAATKMFIDRCNAQDNSVAVVTYGYSILTDTDFYDLSRAGSVDALRDEVENSKIKDKTNDTNTGMALEHVYNKIAQRRISFPNHKFAILVISDGKIDIEKCKEFLEDPRYPDKGEQTFQMLIQQSKDAGMRTAEQCKQDSIPIYCLGIYNNKKEGGNILEPDMQSWSDATGGLYREEDDINQVYNIVREFYLHMTDNPAPVPVTDGKFEIPDNVLEANVEIVPSIPASKMTLARPDSSQVDLSGYDLNVKIREDSQYTMVKLAKPEPGDWQLTFADGVEHSLSVYVTYNLDLSMLLHVPETAYNNNPVTVKLEATKQKVPYYDPAQPATLTAVHADTGSVVAQANMTWNPAESMYEYSFTPTVVGEYRFHAEITTGNMTNVTTNESAAVLRVIPRPVSKAQDLGDFAFSGRLLHGYTPVDYVPDLRGYFSDPDNRGIMGYEVELSEHDFITAVADNVSGKLVYTALKATTNPVTVTVYAIDTLGERSEPLVGTVTVEDAQMPVTMNAANPVPTEPIKIKAMLPEKQGNVVLTGLSSYFVEPNAVDGDFITNVDAIEQAGSQIVDVSLANDDLVLRALQAGTTNVIVTATSSDGSHIDFSVTVQVDNLMTTILLISGGVLLLLLLIALVIFAVVQANKPQFNSMGSLTILLSGDDDYDGTDMLGKYGKRKVKLSEICRKCGMHVGSFGGYLDKITVRPRKNGGISVQCAIKNVPQKEFTLRPFDSRTIEIDPANDYFIKLEYFDGT